jgi:hypothetical protein
MRSREAHKKGTNTHMCLIGAKGIQPSSQEWSACSAPVRALVVLRTPLSGPQGRRLERKAGSQPPHPIAGSIGSAAVADAAEQQ